MSKALEWVLRIASTGSDPQRFATVAHRLLSTEDAAPGGCMDKALTAGHLAASLAEKLHLDGHQARDAYDLALLRHTIGATDYPEVSGVDLTGVAPARALVGERRWVEHRSHLALRLSGAEGLSEGVAHGLTRLFERWDGKGHPIGLVSVAIDAAVCVAQVASDAPSFMMLGCPVAAIKGGRRRAYAPDVVDALVGNAVEIFGAVTYPAEREELPEFTRVRIYSRLPDARQWSTSASRQVATPLPDPSDHTSNRLTARELDVIRLLPRGLTNKEIAAELGISVKTAGRHLENIFRKLQITTRSAAAAIAMSGSVGA